MPGPLYDEIELLLALSKEPLKIQFTLKSEAALANCSATVIAIDSDSRTLTPPIKVIGSALPIVELFNFRAVIF